MRSVGWIPKSIRTLPAAKREVVLLLTLYLGNCFTFSSWPNLSQAPTKPWLLLVWLYGLITLLPLAWRDNKPVTVFAIQWILTVTAWPIMPLYVPVAGIPTALYAVSLHCSMRIAMLALLASLIPTGIAAATPLLRSFIPPGLDFAASFASAPPDGWTIRSIANAAFLVLVIAAAYVVGRLSRASQRHVNELEREQKKAREAAVLAAERRRIARELHDIVSHAVTVILLQAAGAARVGNKDFNKVAQSLTHIETTATQTMAELRRLLGVLEDSNPAHHSADPDGLTPQPGLADLTEVLDSLRAMGMLINDHVEGTPIELDPSIDLAAYRIVREGMMNVLKHVGKDAKPQLLLVWRADSLFIRIDNGTNLAEAHLAPESSAGRGLVGLKERAHTVGGELCAGPHHGGGYRLTATLPYVMPDTHPVDSSTIITSVSRGFTQSCGDQGNLST